MTTQHTVPWKCWNSKQEAGSGAPTHVVNITICSEFPVTQKSSTCVSLSFPTGNQAGLGFLKLWIHTSRSHLREQKCDAGGRVAADHWPEGPSPSFGCTTG